MPKRKSLEARIAEQACTLCGKVRDTPLHTDEEKALDAFLDAIKNAVRAAPSRFQNAIEEAVGGAPRFVPGVTDKRRQPRSEHKDSILYLEPASVNALIAELAGEV